jgi:hypothetical protein
VLPGIATSLAAHAHARDLHPACFKQDQAAFHPAGALGHGAPLPLFGLSTGGIVGRHYGKTIGPLNLLIAAHAWSMKLIDHPCMTVKSVVLIFLSKIIAYDRRAF